MSPVITSKITSKIVLEIKESIRIFLEEFIVIYSNKMRKAPAECRKFESKMTDVEKEALEDENMECIVFM